MKIRLCWLCAALMVAACSGRPTSFEGIEHPRPHRVSSLVGQTRAQVHNLFGTPGISRMENGHLVWSYQMKTCVLLVYFDKDGICRYAETRGNCEE
ncbi:MAG: outer membrane protein assembly factor BamE [Alphaproteobacteria bacterium]